MKKMMIMASILAGFCFHSLKAQDDFNKGFYIKAGGGYFMKVTPVEFPAIGGQPARDRVFNIIPGNPSSQQTVSESTITGSFGEGWRASLTPGYRFSRIFGVELGINYYKSRSQDMMRQRGSIGGNEVLNLYSTGKVTAFDIAPAIVAHLPTSGAVKPYMKVGIIVPIGGDLKINTSLNDQTGSFATEAGLSSPLPNTHIALVLDREESIKANPTIGFQSAVGADFKIGNSISLFAELEYRNVSVGGKDKELKKYEGTATIVSSATLQPVPGAPVTQITMDNASEAAKHVKYHKTITSDMNMDGEDRDRPSDELRSYINIGGLGVNVGIKIPFGN